MNNKEDIVNHMISFIEEKERDYQAEKMVSDTQIKNDMVKSILDELERVIANED